MSRTAVTIPALVLALCFALTSGAAPLRAQTFEVHEADLTELAEALAAGRTTSVELVDAYLARIQAYDRAGPSLNAVMRINPGAHADAEARDRERREGGARGALHGVPVVVKDNYEV